MSSIDVSSNIVQFKMLDIHLMGCKESVALLDLQPKELIFLILILWLSEKGDTQLHIMIRKATAAKGSKIPKPDD